MRAMAVVVDCDGSLADKKKVEIIDGNGEGARRGQRGGYMYETANLRGRGAVSCAGRSRGGGEWLARLAVLREELVVVIGRRR